MQISTEHYVNTEWGPITQTGGVSDAIPWLSLGEQLNRGYLVYSTVQNRNLGSRNSTTKSREMAEMQ